MPDDIEIKLKTTGDTSGAEAVEKSLFKTRTEAEKASDHADVEIAKGKQAAAVQREQAASLREIADAQQRIIAAQLAQAVGQVAEQFRGLNPEMDLAISGAQNFLNVFATTGNPIVATLALTTTAIGGVVTAYRDAEKAVKEIAKNEKQSIKELADQRRDFAAQIRTENLTAFFQAELNALDKQEAVMRRMVELRASERGLAAAQQQAATSAAVAGGASPEGAAAGGLAAGLQGTIQDLTSKLTDAEAATKQLEERATTLVLKANALVENTDEQKAALQAAEEARAAAEESRAGLANFTQVTLNQIQTALVEAQAAGTEISAAGLAALTEAAVLQKAALQAEVDRLGTGASSGAKEALKTLAKVLEDGVIKPDELAKITDILSRVRASREAADTKVFEGFEALQKADEALVQQIQPAVDRIGQTLSAVQQIQGFQDTQANQITEIFRQMEALARKVGSPQSAN